ncbi:MAG: pentapeptide repeat-containing protein [Stenomitos frigidus ULC029]
MKTVNALTTVLVISTLAMAGCQTMREQRLGLTKKCPNCNLQGANLTRFGLENADLRGANLRGANLHGAVLDDADLSGANLQGADLGGAWLERANLQGANVDGANLEQARLGDANLRGASFKNAKLTGAISSRRTNWCQAIMPGGARSTEPCVTAAAKPPSVQPSTAPTPTKLPTCQLPSALSATSVLGAATRISPESWRQATLTRTLHHFDYKTDQNARGVVGSVISLALSPNGKLLASSSAEQIDHHPSANLTKLWHWQTRQVVCTLRGWAAKQPFSPDGRTLAVRLSEPAQKGEQIQFWDLRSGRLQQRFPSPHRLKGVSPDSKILIMQADRIGSKVPVQLWALPSGTLQHTLLAHTQNIEAIAFTPDRRSLATASYDGTIRLWNLKTGAAIRTFDARSKVWSIAISPDGKTLVSGHGDFARTWNLKTGQLTHRLKGQAADYVRSVAISPDSQTIATGTHGEIKLWRLRDGALINTLNNAPADRGRICASEVWSLKFSPDGQTLVSSNCEMINLWTYK